ncbi:hypothetical protein HRJ35_03330 [Shewanella oneidensis MR-1]|uniref:DUF7716 domain-containing protein n=1 Tax=Shewanella oneidensis (strain ATCC 700550 / JCM 31522 / CIP 106686 / LMG 19005 / NCIMB 14063 / MR-1) TaxID=211586 RepID=Q8EKD6_SHEON|nr:hypothetical protein [Shewanella oneidensis]AAN53246.1 protein of unknown function [Shewanella oneidensis MR-1]MDX5997869.1 hypothetical protein [Shewanella oneidensis]MEE2027853.1 hypothetical protein [Shewanella oneidensis]QKG95122.1 hypothetical protein HRJ35_03330 [Shewanella oneidensis MR-1]
MNITSFFGQPESLLCWIGKCIEQPGLSYWLVYQDLAEGESLQLTTPLFPIVNDMRDLSDAEIDAFEDGLSRNDYSYLLNTDQIEDVIYNLKQQKAQPSEQELLEAIIFYYERDAFIDI